MFALVHSVVEESEVLGVEFAGDEVGEIANLRRNHTKRADDEAGDAPRVVGVFSVSTGPVTSAGVPSFLGCCSS